MGFERARAIPLATLACVVGVLVVERAMEGRRVRLLSATVPHSPALHPTKQDAPVAQRAGPDAADAGAPHMLHGDPRRTGRSSARGPDHAHLAWRAHVGGPIEAQVVASPDERTLYAASLDGSVTALDAATGATTWKLALGDRVYSTPCVAPNGTVYVGTDAKRFVAVTPQGTVAWKLETPGEADTGAALLPLAQGGDLVVFAAGPTVYAARAGGDLAWRFDAKKKVFTAPAIGQGGLVVFGSQDHHVYALSPAGTLAWSVDLGADVDGAPAVADDGAIAVGTDGGEIVRLSPTGEVLRRTQVGGYVRGTLSVSRNGDALAGVYGPAPRLVRVGADGEVKGSFGIQGTGARELGVHGGPLEDAAGALFFGAQDDALHALGPDGLWQWSYTTGADVDAPGTLLSNGTLIVGSDDGDVYAFGS